MKYVLLYGAALLTLIVLDAIWLTATKGFVMSQIGHLFAPSMAWKPVILFYALYAGAVVYFAVLPSTSVTEALVRGALLGLTAYMTYDLVNLATLQGYPTKFAIVDITWGTFITATAAFAAALI